MTEQAPWQKLRAQAEKAEPLIAVGAFVVGFLWDAFTLVRVDRLLDQAMLGVYVVGLIAFTVLERRIDREPEAWPRLAPRAAWVTYALQFCVGGLFSGHVVFYARSAGTWASWSFVILLAGLMVANELAQGALRRHEARLVILWLLVFTYGRSAFPSLWPDRDGWALAVGLALATLATSAAVALIENDRWAASRATTLGLCASMAIGTGGLDAAGCIPPLPWAIVHAGVYRDVTTVVDTSEPGRPTRYRLTYQEPPFWAPWRGDERVFAWQEGEAVVVFTAIFAPTGTRRKVFHVWEYRDPTTGQWSQTDRIDVTSRRELLGGADGGFRTYSRKRAVKPGDWHVRVELEDGRTIGTLSFEVVPREGELRPMKERFAR